MRTYRKLINAAMKGAKFFHAADGSERKTVKVIGEIFTYWDPDDDCAAVVLVRVSPLVKEDGKTMAEKISETIRRVADIASKCPHLSLLHSLSALN